jgi:hypothetical protein
MYHQIGSKYLTVKIENYIVLKTLSENGNLEKSLMTEWLIAITKVPA